MRGGPAAADVRPDLQAVDRLAEQRRDTGSGGEVQPAPLEQEHRAHGPGQLLLDAQGQCREDVTERGTGDDPREDVAGQLQLAVLPLAVGQGRTQLALRAAKLQQGQCLVGDSGELGEHRA